MLLILIRWRAKPESMSLNGGPPALPLFVSGQARLRILHFVQYVYGVTAYAIRRLIA